MAEEALLDEVRALAESDRTGDAAARLAAVHPADAADVVVELDDEVRAALIPALPREPLARIIEYLPDQWRADVIADVPASDLPAVLDEVDDDIVADILHEFDAERAQAVLAEMKRASAVAPLLGHRDETAGGHMTRSFISVRGEWSADRAIQHLRRLRPDADAAYYLYAVDPAGRLEGVVSLRDLIVAAPDARLEDIMSREVVSAREDMDQEEMARLVQRYDLVALPVVDASNRLTGMITVDDVLDVVQEEATEDILKLAGIGVHETALSPLPDSARRRLPWLLVNLAVGLGSAAIISQFEDTIARVAAIAAFMPVIAGQGGNAGVQTSTIIVRGLALDEIALGDLFQVLVKELALGVVKGIVFGSAVGIIAYFWEDNGTLALVVFAAMFLNMIVASIGGVMIPMTLRYALRLDPATAAGVFDTMLTDLMGFFIFLGLATIFINRLT
jgi:magnesium transporter